MRLFIIFISFLLLCIQGGWGGDEDDEYQDAALEYVGAYDKINIVSYFVSAMQVASQKEPAVMETLKNTLEPEDQENLLKYVQEAAAIVSGNA